MQPASVQPLPLKSGALQGGLAMEYPFDHRFDSLHIVYDGVNGQLPNLDLFNTAVSIASGQMGIGASLQEMWDHDDSYEMRLQTILRGMVKQGFGYATGAHSSFMPYHIDAITLQTKGEGWQDEMALGRTIEGLCRSLNNLLEHLHQSFFFYLLMQANRFVSIGTYLPSAMLIAGNFTIMAIALWMRTGYYLGSKPGAPGAEPSSKGEKPDSPKRETTAVAPSESNGIMERQLALPLTLVVGLHLLGLVPLYIFNNLSHQVSTTPITTGISIYTNASPVLRTRHIHLPRGGPRPPSPPRRGALILGLRDPQTATVPAHQVLLAPPPRPVSLHARDAELLPLVHDRSALRPAHVRLAARPADRRPPLRRVCARTGPAEPAVAACRAPRRVCVHGRVGGVCLDAGGLWMECVGDVDAGGGVVCMVACVVVGVCASGVFSVLDTDGCFEHAVERCMLCMGDLHS